MTLNDIECNGQDARIFLRDDDVDVVESPLVQLLEICCRHQVPISLAVIPGRLTDECATFLRDCWTRHPQLIELHQHGWMHTNHEAEGKKCEFGLSRAFDRQRADIEAGRARMEQAFHDIWFHAFTPPWNRFTADTRRALSELGYPVLSADGEVRTQQGCLQEIPITLDIYRWKGGIAMRPPAEIICELKKQVKRQQTAGILLHHKVMDHAAFSFLDFLLTETRRYPAARFHTLQSLAASPRREALHAR